MPIDPRGRISARGALAWRGRAGIACALILAGFLSACHHHQPRPLTFEEQEAWMAREQCAQEATQMAAPAWNSDSVYWTAYFTMCMNRFGISDEALSRMWY